MALWPDGMMVAALWPGDVKQEGDNGLGFEHVDNDHTQGLIGVGLVDAKMEGGADDGGQLKAVKYDDVDAKTQARRRAARRHDHLKFHAWALAT